MYLLLCPEGAVQILVWKIWASSKKDQRSCLLLCSHLLMHFSWKHSPTYLMRLKDLQRSGLCLHIQGFYILPLLSWHTSNLLVIILLYLSAKEQYLLPDPNFQPQATELLLCILSSEIIGSAKVRNKFVKSLWLMMASLFTVPCLTKQ